MLQTSRLILRQWRQEDFATFAAMSADTRVMEFFPSVLSAEESYAFAERCTALIEDRGWGLWAVETQYNKKFVGFTGLHVPSVTLPFSPCVEVGWRLRFDAWGQGYAAEAAQAALAFGFNTLRLPEIVSFTAISNLRSQAVMRRLGMRFDGTFNHPTLPENSPLQKHCLYKAHNNQSTPDILCTS